MKEHDEATPLHLVRYAFGIKMESFNRGAKRSASRHTSKNPAPPTKPTAQQSPGGGEGGTGGSGTKRRQDQGGGRELVLASAGRGVADEPGVEPHAVGGTEPDVLVGEAEAGRRDGVRSRQAREHGHVDEPLLQRHERREADHRHAPRAVGQRLQPPRHIPCRRRDARRGEGRRLPLSC